MHPDGREHRARPDDPCPDRGFDELDLAVNPVPVTPPPTWRRTAWFAVGASCAVLTVLVFTAAGLAERPFDRTEAFPGLPTGGLLTAQPLGPSGHPAATTADPGSGGSAMPGDQTGASTDATAGGGPAGSERDGTHSTGAWPATTARQSRGSSTSPPVVSVKPTTGRPPPVPADDLITATEAFYDLLPMDVDLAWDMVGPQVKSRGYDAFRRQWGDARQVELRQIVVDADNSSVLATVRLVAADGTEYVQLFELDLRRHNSLIIDEIVLVSDEGRKPAR